MQRAPYQLLTIAVCLAAWLGAHRLYAASAASTFGDVVAQTARKYLVVRYGGGHEGQRLDSSGLVQQAFARNGVILPRRELEQATVGEQVSPEQTRAGDVLFFASTPGGKSVEHVGIALGVEHIGVALGVEHITVALGDGRLIHVSTRRPHVRIDTTNPYFEGRLIAVRRVVPAAPPSLAEPQLADAAESPAVVASASIHR